MEDTAIQEDVVDEGAVEETVETDIREQLYAKRKQQIAEESSEHLPNEELQDDEESDEDEIEAPPESEEPEMVDLKVDGETIQKPKDEVDAAGGVAAMQKQLSGEKRLAQAAEERKKLARLEEELKKREQALRDQEARLRQEPPQKSGADEQAVATARKKYIDAVYSGNEEAIAEALEEYEGLQFAMIEDRVSKKWQQSQIDPSEIVKKTKAEVAYETSLENGKRQFNEKYSHLAKDPYLYELTDKATAKLRRENPDWMPEKIILSAAQEVDDWYSKFAKQDSAEDLIEQQREKKRNKENIPTAGKKKPGVEKNKKKTPEEIFKEIRAGRAS